MSFPDHEEVLLQFKQLYPNYTDGVSEPLSQAEEDETHVSDEKLLRFLIARNLDLKKAKKMLDYDRRFRLKWRPAQITQECEGISQFLASGCWRVMGKGVRNQPVIWCRVGLWNPHEYSCDTYVRSILYLLEGIKREYLQSPVENPGGKYGGVGEQRLIAIFDLSGWAVWMANYVNYVKNLIYIAQCNYPEFLRGRDLFCGLFWAGII